MINYNLSGAVDAQLTWFVTLKKDRHTRQMFTPASASAYALGMKKLTPAIIAIGLCFAATGASAQTANTNVPGLVVKNVRCDMSWQFHGSIVNRSARELRGKVKLDLLDADQDPVDTVVVHLMGLAAGSGKTFVYPNVKICRSGGFEYFRATYSD